MSKTILIKSFQQVEKKFNAGTVFGDLMIFGDDDMVVSDGYHTIDELYDHRITLYIALCRQYGARKEYRHEMPDIWRSHKHSDGSVFEGWFILGINKEAGKQISYHLPLSRWDDTNFAETLLQAPEFDGHTSADVLERLKTL